MRLRHRRGASVAGTELSPQGPPSCGGQVVPEGWPDYSAWLDEELLAPFFRCTSPGEFLALQRRVDMPRLVEALDDWSAVRLGALGPMESEAAKVLQRKRFSFLVNAHRLYGVYAPVLTLFLFDTSFDDEVRELLVLLAKDKQLQQTVGQMEAAREALARRGFRLSDYPEREEQLRDVVRGLGRAVDDVHATIPGAAGVGGARVYGARADLPPPYQEAFDETGRALTAELMAPGNVALGTFDHLTFGVPLGFYYLAVGTGHGVYTLTQGQYEQATRELAPAALMVGLYAGGKGLRSLSGAKGVAGVGAEGVPLPVLELRLQVLREVVERLRARLGESDFAQFMRWLQGSREVAVLVATHGEPVAMAIIEARGDPVRAQAVFSQARPEHRAPAGPMADAGKRLGGAPLIVEEVTGPASSSIRWKGFADGKLASHFNKHVLEAGEFGGKIAQNQYLKMAKEFAQEKNKRFLERVVGNFIVKYDPATRRTLIGHLKDREIRTFYEADFRDPDPFAAAVELAKSLGGRP